MFYVPVMTAATVTRVQRRLCFMCFSVVSMTASTVYAPEPVFKKRVHGEGITCLYVGCGGVRARFVSASMDGSCKVIGRYSHAVLLLMIVVFDVVQQNAIMF